MTNIQDNLQKVKHNIDIAAKRAGRRPEGINLIGVGKNHSPDIISMAYNCGLKKIGENRIAELEVKKQLLPPDIEWHMIGHLQSNKIAKAIKYADTIHSIDSLMLFKKILKAPRLSSKDKKIKFLLEINISGEESKFGFRDKSEIYKTVEESLNQNAIELIGFMTMAPYQAEEKECRRIFAGLKQMSEQISSSFKIPKFELSMGMSSDYVFAIEEGATMIRIGTAIFGNFN
jgi:pyridoxal phosphate enzyme (YggS family)